MRSGTAIATVPSSIQKPIGLASERLRLMCRHSSGPELEGYRHRLIPRHCDKRGNEWLIVTQSPEPVRSGAAQDVLNVKRAAQPMHFLRRVGSVDP